MEYTLPASDDVNATTLSRIFDNTTNSYKFLFFLALVRAMERSGFNPSQLLSVQDLITDMLVLAWYPHVYFRLSFGKQDQIARALDGLTDFNTATREKIRPGDTAMLHKHLAQLVQNHAQSGELSLARYVPYRLVRVFFPEVSGIKDHEVNGRVAEYCESHFQTRKPPYKFDTQQRQLILHPAWCQYMKQNLPIVYGWTWWRFLEYMQRCNPNVPALVNKLSAPVERESLSAQTKFWNVAVANSNFHCIYSSEPLQQTKLALDHYVPWSFVVHNQLWNLIPTTTTVNSRKSDKLPSLRYFEPFVELQHKAILVTHEKMERTAWERVMESFLLDLGLPDYESAKDKNRLRKAYESTLLPLLSLAETNGFQPNWIYV